METKTSKAIDLFKSGDIVGAFRIFSTFRIGITKDENRKIEIAYECMIGRESYYKSLQLDTASIKDEAIQLIKSKYNV